MISIATSLGIERTQARTEMQRILNLEKELAHVGESLFLKVARIVLHESNVKIIRIDKSLFYVQ
jgi:hypothetical protein